MKTSHLALSGLFAAIAASSCAYDPNYSASSYSGAHGYGNGYGSSNFSTSVFVGTGNPRWGYDPYAGCYYDYTRRSYYDPYLSGYYPVGYRPRYVHGAPHPHGWYRGSGYCPPPTRIRSHTITNYDNRAQSYRSLGRDWSGNVRVGAPNGHGNHDPGDRYRNGWRGEGNRHGQVNPQAPHIPFFSGDGNDRGPSGRGDAGGGGGFVRGNREQPAEPNSDSPRNDLPPPAPAFEAPPQIDSPPSAPPQIEMPAPSPQPEDQPQVPGGDPGGIMSLGEG